MRSARTTKTQPLDWFNQFFPAFGPDSFGVAIGVFDATDTLEAPVATPKLSI